MRAAALCVAASLLACGERAAPSLASASASAASSAALPDDDPPRVTVAFSESASIAIDGALNEPAWVSDAARLGPFVGVSTGRYTGSYQVQGDARLLWDESYLYVAFTVSDRKLTGGFPQDAVDPHLWERDTVEIMIDPAGDGDNKDYFEIQINPQGLVFDSFFEDYNAPRGGPSGPFGHETWSSQAERAVSVAGTLNDDSDRDEGYTVEARLPWSAFAPIVSGAPEEGDTWRMNFYAMENNGGVAWSPILGKGNFHKASRFGYVTFQR